MPLVPRMLPAKPPAKIVAAVNEMVPINCLVAGQRAQIGLVLGQPADVHRLEEIGLRGGTDVEMIQPGSPCIIRLSGQKLCFRADDLLSVLVRPGAMV